MPGSHRQAGETETKRHSSFDLEGKEGVAGSHLRSNFRISHFIRSSEDTDRIHFPMDIVSGAELAIADMVGSASEGLSMSAHARRRRFGRLLS